MQWQIHSHAMSNWGRAKIFRLCARNQQNVGVAEFFPNRSIGAHGQSHQVGKAKPIGGNKAILRWSASSSGDGDWDVANLFRVGGNKLVNPQFGFLEDLFMKDKK